MGGDIGGSSMDTTMTTSAGADSVPAQSRLYRAIWRWHFYAGLLVLPFMILIGITGGLYLFKDELNALIYRNYMIVAPAGTALRPSSIVAMAIAAVPGDAVGYVPPAAADRAAQVRVSTEVAGNRLVFVDPYGGRVLGDLSDGGPAGTPFMGLIRKLHSLEYFGWITNRVMEIVGGWALLLVITGAYLWWPRRQGVVVVTIRGKPGRRVFWRDLHAVTGAFAGLFIFFLALTGMPWSGFWGANVNKYADQAGLAYPPEFWNEVPKSAVPMKDAMTQTSWSLENRAMPASTPDGTAPIGIDEAVAILDGLGIHEGWAMDLPDGAEGVFSASVFPDQVAHERVIHLDQYTGRVLFDGGFTELGPLGKAIEWGISVHMGQEFGLFNQLLMLAACLSIILMAVAAGVMWWKRRPAGTLGAPRYPSDYRIPRGILAIAVVMGVLYPLVGMSLLIALALDYLVISRVPRLRQRVA